MAPGWESRNHAAERGGDWLAETPSPGLRSLLRAQKCPSLPETLANRDSFPAVPTTSLPPRMILWDCSFPARSCAAGCCGPAAGRPPLRTTPSDARLCRAQHPVPLSRRCRLLSPLRKAELVRACARRAAMAGPEHAQAACPLPATSHTPCAARCPNLRQLVIFPSCVFFRS